MTISRGTAKARITPAYAGKRYRNPSVLLCYQDHPRLCGEKLIKLADFYGVTGITPAYAGKRYVGKVVELRS